MMTTGEVLRKAARIAADCGQGGGGWHIQDAYEADSKEVNGERAMSLYHYLFDPSTPGHDVYIWFDTIDEVVLALLFAAEAAEDFPNVAELEQPAEVPSLATKQNILRCMPGTAQQIANETGFVIGTVTKWIRAMRKEQSIHISGWQPPIGRTGQAAAIFSAGMGVDVPYDYISVRKVVKLLRAEEKPRLPKQDPLMNALFGT